MEKYVDVSGARFQTPKDPLKVDVISIQSQVVYGRVGNNVAVPTFNSYGLEVAAVPTVLLSNVPQYPSLHGGAITLEWFEGYLQDLEARQIMPKVKAIQLGYLGGPQQAQSLSAWLGKQIQKYPQLQIYIDPVIGDYPDGIYVDSGMIAAYRDYLLPLANGLTPNVFELEALTNSHIESLEQTIAAARTLIHHQVQWVIVTSALSKGVTPDKQTMNIVVVTQDDVHLIKHKRIDASPLGTGDLYSAALSAQLLTGQSLYDAAREAGGKVVQAIELTQERNSAELLLPF